MERLRMVATPSCYRILFYVVLVLILTVTLSCSRKTEQAAIGTPTTQQATGAPQIAAPDDGQWTMPARDYASWRFSGLSQINTDNVKSLKLAWTFSTGVLRGLDIASRKVVATIKAGDGPWGISIRP